MPAQYLPEVKNALQVHLNLAWAKVGAGPDVLSAPGPCCCCAVCRLPYYGVTGAMGSTMRYVNGTSQRGRPDRWMTKPLPGWRSTQATLAEPG